MRLYEAPLPALTAAGTLRKRAEPDDRATPAAKCRPRRTRQVGGWLPATMLVTCLWMKYRSRRRCIIGVHDGIDRRALMPCESPAVPTPICFRCLVCSCFACSSPSPEVVSNIQGRPAQTIGDLQLHAARAGMAAGGVAANRTPQQKAPGHFRPGALVWRKRWRHGLPQINRRRRRTRAAQAPVFGRAPQAGEQQQARMGHLPGSRSAELEEKIVATQSIHPSNRGRCS